MIGIYTFPAKQIASSSNGRTADSDSVNRGSNPCEAAIKKQPRFGAFFVAISMGENHDLWFGFPPFAPRRREGTRQAPKGCAVAFGRAHNPCEAAIKKQPRLGLFLWLSAWVRTTICGSDSLPSRLGEGRERVKPRRGAQWLLAARTIHVRQPSKNSPVSGLFLWRSRIIIMPLILMDFLKTICYKRCVTNIMN